MNQNLTRGLVILGLIIIAAVALWRLYLAGPPPVGGPVQISKPSVAPSPAAGPKPPAQPALPTPPPIKTEPPQGIAPLQEPIRPAPEITFPPAPALQEHYGILVETYRNYPEAAKLLDKLKKPGSPAFVQRDPRDSSRFQVWLGPFTSQNEAQAAEKALHAKFKKPLKIEQIENPVPK
jgi:cell division septation protein DedD